MASIPPLVQLPGIWIPIVVRCPCSDHIRTFRTVRITSVTTLVSFSCKKLKWCPANPGSGWNSQNGLTFGVNNMSSERKTDKRQGQHSNGVKFCSIFPKVLARDDVGVNSERCGCSLSNSPCFRPSLDVSVPPEIRSTKRRTTDTGNSAAPRDRDATRHRAGAFQISSVRAKSVISGVVPVSKTHTIRDSSEPAVKVRREESSRSRTEVTRLQRLEFVFHASGENDKKKWFRDQRGPSPVAAWMCWRGNKQVTGRKRSLTARPQRPGLASRAPPNHPHLQHVI